MNILSPVDKKEEVEQLIEAGANGLYCGIISKDWLKKYNSFGSMNRREWVSNNFTSFEDLAEAVKITNSHKTPIFLAINAHYYTEDQYPLLLKEVKKAVDMGITGFIVADMGLLLTLKEMGIDNEILISTGGTTLNSETANFYKELGAKAIILPRHLTIEEIREIKENSSIDLECFIFNEGCFNLDGFCTYTHGVTSKDWRKRALACSLPYDINIITKNQLKKRLVKDRIRNITRNLLINCGACALYDLKKIGIESIKIIGRGNPTEKKLKDIKFFKTLLTYLNEDVTKQDFEKKAKELYQETFHHKCSYRNCYYPSF